MAAISETEEFEFRKRMEDEAAAATSPPQDYQRKPAIVDYNIGLGMPEALTSMATGAFGQFVGGPARFYYGLATGESPREAAAAEERTAAALTYQPRTKAGQVIAEYNPLALAGKAVAYGGGKIGDVAQQTATEFGATPTVAGTIGGVTDIGSQLAAQYFGARAVPATARAVAPKIPFTQARAQAQARELIQNTLANDPQAIAAIQAANAAQPNVLASQAAAALPGQYPAYQALLSAAEATPLGEAGAVRAATERRFQDILDRAAGGATEAEQIAARKKADATLQQITTPMREKELATAGETTRQMVGLEQQGITAREAAAQNVANVRKLESLADRADEWARDWAPGGKRQAGAPIPPTEYTYPGGELAPRARAASATEAEQSLAHGQIARESEAALADLQAKGLEPLNTNTLLSSIENTLSKPEVKTNQPLTTALSRVRDMLADGTGKFGVISPDLLYAIRKNGITSVIDELTKGVDIKSKKKFAASVMKQINPMIDEAIVKAGGEGWRDYTRTFAQGKDVINQQKLFGELSKLFKTNPDAFVKVVKGENTAPVRKIFGNDKFEIKDVLGDRYNQLLEMSDYIQSRAKVSEALGPEYKGGTALSEVMQKSETIPNKLLSLLGGKTVNLSNALIQGLEGNMSLKMKKIINEAAKSGKSMNELLANLPYNQQLELMKAYQATKGMKPIIAAGAAFSEGQQ